MLREWTTPPTGTGTGPVSAVDDVFRHAAHRPDQAGAFRKAGGVWTPVTWREIAARVESIARGLIAEGVAPGDRIALMSATRYEWMLCDFAIWAAGAVSVPIYDTSSTEQIEWILADSGAVAAFAGDERCQAGLELARTPAIRDIWRLDGDEALRELEELEKDAGAEDVDQRRAALTAGTMATIVYTSGTTGRPKGCVLTHGNLVSEVGDVTAAEGVSELVLNQDASILLFLPLAHIFARVVQLAAVRNAVPIAHLGDRKELPAELRAFRPTVVLGVPRVFEKVYNAALLKASSQGHRRLFEAAAATAVAYSQALDTTGPGIGLGLRRSVFDRLVYRKLRESLGGRVSYAISGAAPLGARLGHFLRGAGVNILEGWGLTETASGHTLNLPAAQLIGTVGRPLPGCAVRLSPDGEILVKGPNVFRRYWNDERSTAEAFEEEGWFRTGDLGRLEDGGFLRIVGRKKEIIVTASGKNVIPGVLEDRLGAHWLIDQCVVLGDARPYIGALITVDPEAFSQWKRDTGRPAEAGIADLRDDPDLLAVVQEAVDEANTAVSRAEAIKRFRVLGVNLAIGDELTPTQKVRREYVLRKYADEVEALYEGAATGHVAMSGDR